MGQVFHRIISCFLTAVFIFSAFITGTYSWSSFQTTVNEASQTIAAVRLQKREKLPDGTVTKIPVEGAVFYLFTADGEQIGGKYVTDEAGEISLKLPAGNYFFEEFLPASGYGFDSSDGEPITHYPFILSENDSDEIVVTAYNIRLSGSLAVQKTVKNSDGSPLTSEQLTKSFTFTVEFSDNGTYVYRKNNGKAEELESGETLTLRHGETALFENLPVGITYTVTEKEISGYTITATGHRGTVGTELSAAYFINTCYDNSDPPEDSISLTVKKVLSGEYPASDEDIEFEMTIIINGKPTDFKLKSGEIRRFQLKPGDRYEVREKDYYTHGYSQMIENGFGTAADENIDVTVTNTFTGVVMTEISGEKTWQGVDSDDDLIPESITLLLKDGERVAEKSTVMPDEDGKWVYSFTAPKYNSEGKEIVYTVEELPVKNFRPSYKKFDIVNTYISPAVIEFPIIYKMVEGDSPPDERFTFCIAAMDNAPMPQSVENGFLTLSVTGSGELSPGEIIYNEAGVYTYTVTETVNNLDGWIFDISVFYVTVTVTEEDNTLKADTVITKNDEAVDRIDFVNRYEKGLPPQDTTVIEGDKIWNHGDNPPDSRPDHIVVLVYGDDELVIQQEITSENDWHYCFELPKYNNSGKEIVYTVDELAVDGYDKKIEGYNLINTYITDSTDDGSSPQTGERNLLLLWIILLISSFSLIIAVFCYKKYHEHRKQVFTER